MGKISDALQKSMGNTVTADEKTTDPQNDHISAPQPESFEAEERVTAPEQDVASPPPAHESFEEKDKPLNEPQLQHTWDERLDLAVNHDQYLPEIFKTLRSRILFPGEDKPVPKTIMITSVAPMEGKSFVTANLGISLAQGMDQHSLLVSCDLRRPSLSRLFGMSGQVGLAEYLSGFDDLASLIRKTTIEKLSLLASGQPPANPAELLGSSRMKRLVEELAQRYDDRIIIFDSPPFQFAAETTILAKMVDKVILVVKEGGAPKHQVVKLVEEIGQDKLLGAVYNGHTTNIIERTLMKGYNSYQAEGYAQ